MRIWLSLVSPDPYCPGMKQPATRFAPAQSALEIAKGIGAGDLSPAAAIEQSLAAIAAIDTEIAAFVVTAPDQSRSSALKASGPLAGLALGVKDAFDTCDFPTEKGTPIYAGNRPRSDASVVALARRAGATVIGKTTTTELQHRTPFSSTRNPHNPAHTPGGSSSGSAAAVAAGMIPIAIGAQTAGSVIRPAAFCGIAGFKPSFRLLPTVGLQDFAWMLDTAGLFASSVADVAYFAEHLTQRSLRVDGSDPGTPRIGVMRLHVWDEASAEMQAAIEQTAKRAEKAGAKIVHLDMSDTLIEAFDSHLIIQNYQGALALAWEHDTHREALSPALAAALDEGKAIPTDVYDLARSRSKRGRRALSALFDSAGIDVILTPSASGAAPAGLSFTGDHSFNRLWTLMGTPCVNVPGLFGADNLPLGVQIVAPFGRDLQCLQAAAFIERIIA